MTLEIYDYLWIRNALLTTDTKEINEAIINEDQYQYVLTCILGLLEMEDLPLAFDGLVSKIYDIVHYNRFKYKSNKVINDLANNIIGKLNQYKSLNEFKKEYLVQNFVEEEISVRNLPEPFSNDMLTIAQLLPTDFIVYTELMNVDGLKYVEIDGDDALDYISLVNLIMNKYPELLENEYFKECIVSCLNQIVKAPNAPRALIKYSKSTLNKLDIKNKRLLKK